MPLLRVGIAGLGFGQAVHLPVFAGLPDVHVVALASSRRDRAEAVAAGFPATDGGTPRAFDDLDAFLDAGLDAVSLALPPALGARVAGQALARGIAVLGEKPLAASHAEAAALAHAAVGRTTAINFSFAELDAFQAARAWLAGGALGAVRNAAVTWLSHSYAHRNGSWGWKLDALRGGGVMASQGSHALYLAEWLLGPVTAQSARFDRRATAAVAPAGACPAEDTASVLLGLGGEGALTMLLSNASPGSDLHRWEIICEEGTLVLERTASAGGAMSGFTLTAHKASGDSIAIPVADPSGDGRADAFRGLAKRFVVAAKTHASCDPDFAAGARVQELMEETARLAGSFPGA